MAVEPVAPETVHRHELTEIRGVLAEGVNQLGALGNRLDDG
jgi:hypothetical protein